MSAWGELDHIILFCDFGAPEADALAGRGLHEGPSNSHPGQGTANRRFFFSNAYLELLWVENPVEARSAESRPNGLWDRWIARRNGACPFGLVFRPGSKSPARPPDSWTYSPRYFPPGFSIEVARGIPPNEPLLFYLPFARPARVEEVDPPGPAASPLVGSIVGATVHLPGTAALSPALNALVGPGPIAVEPAREYLLDLFHFGGSSEFLDLRPELPIRFRPIVRPADAKH